MTNADKIRAMNDEQLADFLCKTSDCSVCQFGTYSGCKIRCWLAEQVESEE